MLPEIVRNPNQVKEITDAWRSAGFKIALVPTMGAIHDGHLDLVRAGKARGHKVIASIFVNPTQFAAHEDLSTYPRDEIGDQIALGGGGCDLIYAPSVATMYPPLHSTSVLVGGVSAELEGIYRPHFFSGVATIVAKLLIQIGPNFAMFGEKDWQQLQVVTNMVRDLGLSVTIVPVATRREADGLAMSSRNAYLTPQSRAIAPALHRALKGLAADLAADVDRDVAHEKALQHVLRAGFTSVDYLSARHAQTLAHWQHGDPMRVLGAAYLGKTRLIDNVGLSDVSAPL